jgi:hypothetical protein
MRTLRLSLVGMVIVALLGGLGGSALARTDGSTKVTGSVVGFRYAVPPEVSEDGVIGEDWVGHVRGRPFQEWFEWSDPRLPSEAEVVGNAEAYGDPLDGDVGIVALSATWTMEDADGSWVGPWIGWCDEQDLCHGLVTLTGHGAYEGYYVMLTERPGEDAAGKATQEFEGAILAGEMPPVPAEPQTTSE